MPMAGLLAQISRLATTFAGALIGVVAAMVFLVPVPWASAGPTTEPSPAGCNALLFGGQWYCSGTMAGVKATAYGTGKRVVIKSVTVTARSTTSVTVGAWVAQSCLPGNYCGATLKLETLTVTWTAADRPGPGDVINLFGATRTGSLTPAGYQKLAYCPIEWC